MSNTLNDEITIKCIADHIPTQDRLGGVAIYPGLLDAYSSEYFVDCKYLSDSDMCWREDVYEIVKSKKFSQIQILTHPIWYNDTELSKEDILTRLIYLKTVEHHKYLDILCKSHRPELEDVVNDRCRRYDKRYT